MVFSSYAFLAFLVVVVAVYAAGVRIHEGLGKPILILASLVFYGWAFPSYLVLLLGSCCMNFALSRSVRAIRHTPRAPWLLGAGIAANLGLIAWFKYLDLLLGGVNWLLDTSLPLQHILLPIGISFFTFQQIGLLVDEYQGKVGYARFFDFLFLICFFPHLIAGPIVRQSDLLPQVANRREWRLRPYFVTLGFAVFSLGLFKKTLLSDYAARYSDHIFETVGAGVAPGFVDAWIGAITYSFQIYFDFSGYSDMAVGLAYIFGFTLPINFFSPYKSTSVREFWRRWHISLSNFLRDYLYKPLGGSHYGLPRTLLALFATMVIGGLWHGASVNFIVWGALHGAFLCVYHVYANLRARGLRAPGGDGAFARAARRALAVVATYLLVTLAWMYFRAPDVATSTHMIRAMLGLSDAASFTRFDDDMAIFIGGYLAILWFAPNSAQIFRRFGMFQHAERYMPKEIAPPAREPWWRYALTPRWAIVSAAMFLIAWFALSNLSPFIYFQF